METDLTESGRDAAFVTTITHALDYTVQKSSGMKMGFKCAVVISRTHAKTVTAHHQF